MKQGGGKRKGGTFERLICAKLSLWVSGGRNRDLFWRSAMSGGRATVGQRKGHRVSRVAGDICATAPEGHALTNVLYFELKSYKRLFLERFLLTGTGKLADFWRKTCREARKHHRHPVLIAKENGLPVLWITRPGVTRSHVSHQDRLYNRAMLSLADPGAVVYKLDDVLACTYKN